MQSTSASPNKSIMWLCVAQGFERMGYYGFRSIIVLFMIGSLDEGGLAWSQEEALSYYATFTAAIYICALIGGLAGDLILGSYRSTIAGLVIVGGSMLSLGYVSAESFEMVGLILAFGNGLVKPNIPAMIIHQLQHSPEKADSVFTSWYIGHQYRRFCSWYCHGDRE